MFMLIFFSKGIEDIERHIGVDSVGYGIYANFTFLMKKKV